MIAKIDLDNNNILKINDFDNEIKFNGKIWYVKGQIDGCITQDYKINSLNRDDLNLGKIYQLSGQFSILASSNGLFDFSANDLSGLTEIFYSSSDRTLLISDSLFEIARYLETLTYDLKEVNFFLKHGYCRTGKTFFEGLLRVPPGRLISIKNSQVLLNSYLGRFNGHKVDYNVFKGAFDSSMSNLIGKSKKNLVMLSGGIDSTVLLAELKKRELDVKALTIKFDPPSKLNCIDLESSKMITEKLNVEHELVNFYLDNIKMDDLIDIVYHMPFSSHLSVHFLELFKSLPNKDIICWCGQNNDTLYNFGPTEKGAIIHRFLVSAPYINMLKDVKGHKKFFVMKKISDFIIKNYYKIFYDKNYVLPNNFQELMKFFEESTQYLALSPDKYNISSSDKTFDSSNAIKMLFDEKIGSFYTGGDNKSVAYSSKMYNVDLAMPYSNTNMVHLYRNLHRSWNDVINPKLFLYKYAERELGFSKEFFNKNVSINNSVKNEVSWEKYIINDTIFGNELKEISQQNIKFHLKSLNFSNILRLFWINIINEKLKDQGVFL